MYALFLGNLVLNVRGIVARSLRLRELDLENLDFAGELEHLVLDLAVLERFGSIAGGSVDRGVEVVGLGGLSSLAHRLHVVRDTVVEGGEVETGERVDEDSIRLGLGVAGSAVGDLEVGVAGGRASATRNEYERERTYSWTANVKVEASEPPVAAAAVDLDEDAVLVDEAAALVDEAALVEEAFAEDEALAAALFVPVLALPPVTPLEAWPAAAVSNLMFELSLVCSSATLSSRSEVSSPEAFACAIYRHTRLISPLLIVREDEGNAPGCSGPGSRP